MKKDLINRIKVIASVLPEKWETVINETLMSGREAALTVVGKSPYNPEKNYIIKTPVFTRINHESRLKDGIKRKGEAFINEYVNHVCDDRAC